MLLTGNALDILPTLPACSVQTCVTSPPYYGLRDYGVDGQIGLEESPESYIDKLVAVFREVRRVLKDDGTCWVNIGDSYAGSHGTSTITPDVWAADRRTERKGSARFPTGYKPKDLLMIPARVALALQADGWYLRSEIIWHKPNPMPESVRDRPTKAHEMIYLLAKQPRYFYDAEAIKEPAAEESAARYKYKFSGQDELVETGMWHKGKDGNNNLAGMREAPTTRNRRDVWTVTTKPYKEAHFATFPPDLIEPCILAGTSAKGECPRCGRAWVRVVERPKPPDEVRPNTKRPADSLVNRGFDSGGKKHGSGQKTQNWLNEHPAITLGWRPSCACVDESDHNGPYEPVPQTVLDPFNGSGTTGAVAVMHGRNYVGIELNPAYVELSERRINGIQVELT